MKDDRRLIREYLTGSTAAFGVLFDRHNHGLYAFAFRLLGHRQDAEDLCQTTWLRAIRSLSTYVGRGSFRAWLYAIALSVHRNERRRRSLDIDLQPDLSGIGAQPHAADLAVRLDTASRAGRAWGKLAPEQREVLALHRFQGLKYREIAEMLACPVGTVKSRLHYALAAFRAAFESTCAPEEGHDELRTRAAEPDRAP